VLAEAASRSPEDPKIHTSWGILALERQEAGVARQRLQRARELFRNPPPALWYWAATRAAVGTEDLEFAWAWPRKARSGTRRTWCSGTIARVCSRPPARSPRRRPCCGRTIAEDASLPQPFKNLGDLCYRSGRYEDAVTLYDRATRWTRRWETMSSSSCGNLAFRERNVDPGARLLGPRGGAQPRHQLARANLDTLRAAP
jgi:hypothetical protein